MRLIKLFFLAGLWCLLASTPVWAQSIVLISKDGSTQIRGELIEFDGESYKIRSVIGEVVIDALQVTCQGEGCPAVDLLKSGFSIAGSKDLVNGLIPALLDDYSAGIGAEAIVATSPTGETSIAISADGTELASINLDPSSSLTGLQGLLEQKTRLAVTTRPVITSEVEEFKNAGLGDLSDPEREILLALDGLVIVTAAGNPVKTITVRDIARVFSGRITNWSELGGRDAAINLYVRANDSDTGSLFQNLVMAPQQAEVLASARKMGSDRAVSGAVLSDPNGIGIVSFSSGSRASALTVQGACGIQTSPTAFTIKTEEYPLAQRLLLYRTSRQAPAQVNNFASYVASSDAQAVIEEKGYVNQTISSLDVDNQGLRFAAAMWPSDAETSLGDLHRMVRELITAERSTITFRFTEGSSDLDTRALADIRRLADLLAAGGSQLDNKELLLVGFTDSLGSREANQALSVQRARQVRDTLRSTAIPGSLDRIPINAIGYGEISPLSCNDTPTGRQVNRRVEVWLRDLTR